MFSNNNYILCDICNIEIENNLLYYKCNVCKKILCNECIIKYINSNCYLVPKCVCGLDIPIDKQIILFSKDQINNFIYNSMKIYISKEITTNINKYSEIYNILRIIKSKKDIDRLYYFYCSAYAILQIIYYRSDKEENNNSIDELIKIKDKIYLNKLKYIMFDCNQLNYYFKNFDISNFILSLYSSDFYLSIEIDIENISSIKCNLENIESDIKIENLISFINYKNYDKKDGLIEILDNNNLNYIFGINYNYETLTNTLLIYVKSFIEYFYKSNFSIVNIFEFANIISCLQINIYDNIILNKHIDINLYSDIIINFLYNFEYNYSVKSIISKCYLKNCLGNIVKYNNDIGKCNICNSIYCINCLESLDNLDNLNNHSCNLNNKENIKYLKLNSQICPECGINISKIDGCNSMYCINCNNMFDYITGTKINNNLHNPEKKIMFIDKCNTPIVNIFNYNYYKYISSKYLGIIDSYIDELRNIEHYKNYICKKEEYKIKSYILLFIYNYISIDELYKYIYSSYKNYSLNNEIKEIIDDKYNTIEDILQWFTTINMLNIVDKSSIINIDENKINEVIKNVYEIIKTIDRNLNNYKILYSIKVTN